MKNQRVLVVGLGNMGMSHALAYARIPGFEVVGSASATSTSRNLPAPLAGAPSNSPITRTALAELKPDVVSINTLPDTHADFAIKAMEAGAHVFVEKPLADTVANAEKVVATARAHRPQAGRRLYPAPASLLDPVHRDRARRSAARWSSA